MRLAPLAPVLLAGAASAAVPTPTPPWEVRGTERYENLGWMVGVVDTNGDGYDDLLAAGYDPDGSNPYDPEYVPYLRVFHGGPTGPATAPDLELAGTSDTPLVVGDFHGDGYGDVLVGHRLYEGSAAGLVSPGLTRAPPPDRAAVGDFDGDGDDDLATTVAFDSEVVDVTLGGPGGLEAAPAVALPVAPYSGPSCGGASLHAFDVDADGDDDLAVSCMAGSELLLYEGDPAGLAPDRVTRVTPAPTLRSRPTLMLEASGDVDADGFPDLVATDPLATNPANGSIAGFVMILPGGPDGLDPVPLWETFGRPDAQLGWEAEVGDFDADGDADLLVGATRVSNPERDEGAIEVFLGEPAGFSLPVRWFEGDASMVYVGEALAIGDLDANGAADLAAGVKELDGSRSAAFVFFSDLDGDGIAVGDCDPSDPTAFPGALEIDGDGVDQSCDGRDAALGIADLGPDDLVITEVMRDPAAAPAEAGQWFEVLVRAAAPVDLVGLAITADGEGAVEGFLVAQPGERVVIGRSADPAANGGLAPRLALPEVAIGDRIALANDDGVLVELDLARLPLGPGAAAGLAPDAPPEAAADPARWCPATSTYGEGDRGTPGAANDPCVADTDPPATPAEPTGESPRRRPEGGCGCGRPGSPWLGAALLVAGLARRRRA